MKAVFVSDAHLRSMDSESYRRLLSFLDFPEGALDDLFILGDFFDFWFCRNSNIYPEFVAIIEKLVSLKKRGIRIHFCEGNHDFFLGDYFSKIHDMAVYTEWAYLTLDGTRVLISHGDTVDRTNKKYLFLRKLLRSRLFYTLQHGIPPWILWKIARLSSTVSKEFSADKADVLAKKMEDFSLKKFQENYDAVILGHCHTPLLKEHVIGGHRKTFVSLGEWRVHYSYLYYEDGRFALSFYNPSP